MPGPRLLSQKEYYLQKYDSSDISFLINRKLLIHKQLEQPARTYVVYSDLHGSYDKFMHWLKNGMGYIHIAVSEIIGLHYSEKIWRTYERLFVSIHRSWIDTVHSCINDPTRRFQHEQFFFSRLPASFLKTLKQLEQHDLTRPRIIKDILHVLRRITRGDEHRIFKNVPEQFQENMLRLYSPLDNPSFDALLDGISQNESLYNLMTGYLVKIAIVNMIDKHVNLGDTFDRGDSPDKLITLYRDYFDKESYSPPLHYIWGNHDILWMGASVGNPILCMTALRISMRYNNVEFLQRYGFNLEPLRRFAASTYTLPPTGSYCRPSQDAVYPAEDAIRMTKTLLLLESKLILRLSQEANAIGGDIDYSHDAQRYRGLLELLPTGVPEDILHWQNVMKQNPLLTDVFWPTLDPAHPDQLTSEEQHLVDNLVAQFTTLPKFQDDMKWLFWKGEMYRVVDNTLYYHAALPANELMQLDTLKGLAGKDLLDWLQRDIKRVGDDWSRGIQPTVRQKMLLYYLWSGAKSPFFCKSKMATLERAVFKKELAALSELTTWKENQNYYYKFIRDDRFLNLLLKEFHAERLVMGHTPVKTPEQSILSQDIRAFIIDGGAAEAYGDQGATLINTPDFTYLIFQPTLEEFVAAENDNRLASVKIHPLEEKTRTRLRDVEKGYFLRQELAAIDELLEIRLQQKYHQYFEEEKP